MASEVAIAAAKQAAINVKGKDKKAVVQFANPGTISLKVLQDMEAASGNTNMSICGESYTSIPMVTTSMWLQRWI